MKTTIRSLALLLGMAVFFSACKKDKDDVTNKGSFTYETKTYETNYAVNTTYEDSYSDLFLVSSDYTTGGFSGKINGVGFTFDNKKVTAGTYTFKSDSDPGFDPTKHFFDAYAALGVNYPDGSTGEIIGDITGGTATVTVSGSNLTISYELDFNGKKLTGTHTGTVKQINE